jgi:glutathione S-transferase
MPTLRFITSDICPFAHRAWLALEASGAAYEKVDVTIAAGKKEPFFTALYQRSLGANEGSDGKVPVIDDDGFVMCESGPVSAYIDETRGGGKLGGASAVDRASIAVFGSVVGDRVMQKFYPFLMAQTDEAKAKGKLEFEAALGAMSDALRTRGGPFVLGASVSLADTSVYPFWTRAVVVLGHYREWTPPSGERFGPLHTWAAAMGALPFVSKTAVDGAVFIEGYRGYATGAK